MRSSIADGDKRTHRHSSCTGRVRNFVPESVTVSDVAVPRMSFLTKPRLQTSNRLFSAGAHDHRFQPALERAENQTFEHRDTRSFGSGRFEPKTAQT